MRITTMSMLAVALAAAGCAGRAAPAQTISLDGEPHVTVRVEAGSVWVSARAWTAVEHAWTTPARGPVEQLAVRVLPGGGFEVSFRQGGVSWWGEIAPDRRARGPLRSAAVGLATTPPAPPDARGSR
jgi:hypothetical protein